MPDAATRQPGKKPRPTFAQRLLRRARLLYFQYEVCLGPYVFEPWEKFFIFLFFASIVGITIAALYKQATLLASLLSWHWQRHASNWELWRPWGPPAQPDPAGPVLVF